ncbi:bifunctional riboflavin kinase/FAD synthetase [Litorihabitans aurantiacus]|uniref:Riboflavin biosynthesis protein n=1 Tax=Litorihabitans aurantiacus TaxID=1930061 RepID=A0AA38CP79_9MICO|nr:bifunctional riboflavin kinase/FAD synthetase [Litorihabitans aurantiacus]GMA31778.1 riboflavin biosynthesis protein [Litorihabitans aurantiacus]
MQVWEGLGRVPAGTGPSVVTIGNFDGVHRGHAEVLAHVVAQGRARGAIAVAMTFDPHPSSVHRPHAVPDQITGLGDKLELLAAVGLDATLVVAYTADFASQGPEQFVRRYLVDALRPVLVVVGHDVRFGADNSGDRHTMAELGRRHGFDVEVLDDVASDEQRRWSSTWARELLAAGRMEELTDVLGREHTMRGAVVHGEARGRLLGFPTANLDPASSGAVPADGVYAGWLVRGADTGDGDDGDGGGTAGERLPAAISVGTNPTFDGVVRQVEAHVIGRTDLDLYGEEVVVEFVRRLRPTVRYEGVEALVAQMHADCDEALAVLGLR